MSEINGCDIWGSDTDRLVSGSLVSGRLVSGSLVSGRLVSGRLVSVFVRKGGVLLLHSHSLMLWPRVSEMMSLIHLLYPSQPAVNLCLMTIKQSRVR